MNEGYCQCGCGRQTKISNWTDKRIGAVKGQPRRFVHGHQSRKPAADLYEVRDCGYRTSCWCWLGSANELGYGEIQRGNIRWRAHRWFYAQAHGPLADDQPLDHLCRNPGCVNPEHLEPVTWAENVRRGKGTLLTPEQVREIRRLHRETRPKARELGARFGVAESTIREITRGHNWRGV